MKQAVSLFLLTSLLISSAPVFADESSRSTSASEPDVNEAKRRFQRGIDLYREGSLDAALAEFNKAYQLSSNYKVLYNIGGVQAERRDYVAALRAYEEYLKQGNDELSPERREDVARDIKTLRNRVAEVTITTNAAGAQLLVDGASAGELHANAPVLINSGIRRLQLRKAGYLPDDRSVTLAGGDSVRLEWDLKREPLTSPGPSAAPTQPGLTTRSATTDEASGSRLPMWISIASTGVFAGAAGTFALLTRQSKKDLEQEVDKYPYNRAAADDARSELKRNALLTDVFLAGTVVAGGLSAYFILSGPSAPEAQDRARHTGVRVSASGVTLDGTF
jgi:tetratricopeptide (TPR) repeat protein